MRCTLVLLRRLSSARKMSDFWLRLHAIAATITKTLWTTFRATVNPIASWNVWRKPSPGNADAFPSTFWVTHKFFFCFSPIKNNFKELILVSLLFWESVTKQRPPVGIKRNPVYNQLSVRENLKYSRLDISWTSSYDLWQIISIRRMSSARWIATQHHTRQIFHGVISLTVTSVRPEWLVTSIRKSSRMNLTYSWACIHLFWIVKQIHFLFAVSETT